VHDPANLSTLCTFAQIHARMLRLVRLLLFPLAVLVAVLPLRADEHSWPGVFNPFNVVTLNFELDPAVWEAIKRDQNVYDPLLNIRVPVLMWADGEEPILVQLRRKSDRALPSEENPQKVSLKVDINEFVSGQEWRGLKKLSLENGNGGSCARAFRCTFTGSRRNMDSMIGLPVMPRG
jgi:hypothetical protein